MIRSMTAFASRSGSFGPVSWAWEMRGVNARGLDLRLRLPEGIAGLEVALRAALTAGLARGNVTVNLRLNREDSAQTIALDDAQLTAVLTALDAVQERAFAMGVTLAQPTAADVLAQRGALVAGSSDDDDAAGNAAALANDIKPLLADFIVMRASEGAGLLQAMRAETAHTDPITDAGTKETAERERVKREKLTR